VNAKLLALVMRGRQVAQSTPRILHIKDGRVIEDHRIRGPLEEDLPVLAGSKLGQAIMVNGDPLLEKITAKEELVLCRILVRVQE
jgi:hypothetical protein